MEWRTEESGAGTDNITGTGRAANVVAWTSQRAIVGADQEGACFAKENSTPSFYLKLNINFLPSHGG